MGEFDIKVLRDYPSSEGLRKISVETCGLVCSRQIDIAVDGDVIRKLLVNAKGMEDLYYIESAAVSDEEYGNPIYPPAKRCLTQHGVQFDSLKTACTITKADYDRFDRIICMDRSNLRWLSRITGDDPQKKVHLMMSYTGNGHDVADPWYSGDLTDVYVFT